MQINLRKAQKLRKSIEGVLNAATVGVEIAIDVDDLKVVDGPVTHTVTVESRIEAGRNDAKVQAERFVALSGVLARLRVAIAKKNLEAGIDEILAKSAEVERNIKLLDKLSRPARESVDGLKVKIQRLQANLSRPNDDMHSYRSTPSSVLSVNVVDKALADDVAARVTQLRREKEELEDRRLAVNGNTFVEIGEDDEKVLRDMNVI